MKKFIKPISILVCLCILVGTFVACGNVTKAEGVTYISLRINPEIEMVADKDGEIIAVNAINNDGETVLSEVDLIGMTAEEAGEAFTDKAADLGFFDPEKDKDTVYIDVEGEDATECEEVEKKLSERIHKYFNNNGINGKVSPETLEKYAGKVDEWGVSAGHAKMIMRTLDLYPEMTEEEVLSLKVSERIQLIKNNSKKNGLTAELRAEYKAEINALKEEYAEMFALSDSIEEITAQLADETLAQEEIDALNAELATNQARYDELKSEFDTKCEEIKATYSARIDESKEAYKAQAKERKNNLSK